MAKRYDLLSQIFGAIKGHQLNTEIDSIGSQLVQELLQIDEAFAKSVAAAELVKLGYPGSIQGLGEYLGALIEGIEVKAVSALPAQAATDIDTAFKNVISAIVKVLPTTTV